MNDSVEPRATGGCLCGAVRFEVRGALRGVLTCHCGQCRRIHGHQGAYAAAARADLAITAGRGLKWYVSSPAARRGFCGDCGSPLFWEPAGRDYTAIAAGSLDQPTGLKTIGHIYTADIADYYEIADGLAQWPGEMDPESRQTDWAG